MRHFAPLCLFLSVIAVACSPAPKTEQQPVGAAATSAPEAALNTKADPELEAAVKSMGLLYLADQPPAIDFTLEKLGGGKVKLSDFKDKVVILNFWATWCGPCRVEMPSMQSLYDQIKDQDVVMLAVDSQETPEVVDEFIKEFKYTFPVLLDTSGSATAQYSIQAIPTTYIIDRNGRVVAGKAGSHDWSNPAVRKGLDLLLSRI
jgi:peroxiredoxin